VVDYFSRYFEVLVLRSTCSTKIIEALKPIFDRFGVPHTLKTDNGPQLVSEEFETFLAENGIEHRTTPPFWPQANGEVEPQNRTLMKSVHIAYITSEELENQHTLSNCDPNSCEVVNRKGGEVTIRSTAGAEIKRNVSFVKKYRETLGGES